jgi:hypothetical protein
VSTVLRQSEVLAEAQTPSLSATSSVDGRHYFVQDLPDKGQAADMLATINSKCLKLLQRLQKQFPDDVRVVSLHKRYNPDNISEGSSGSGYTSYSVNKGQKLVICVRQKDQSFADINDIMYVVIHELAHLATEEIGHTKTFWTNFKFLIHEASDEGVYRYVNYRKEPKQYCGIVLTSTVHRIYT